MQAEESGRRRRRWMNSMERSTSEKQSYVTSRSDRGWAINSPPGETWLVSGTMTAVIHLSRALRHCWHSKVQVSHGISSTHFLPIAMRSVTRVQATHQPVGCFRGPALSADGRAQTPKHCSNTIHQATLFCRRPAVTRSDTIRVNVEEVLVLSRACALQGECDKGHFIFNIIRSVYCRYNHTHTHQQMHTIYTKSTRITTHPNTPTCFSDKSPSWGHALIQSNIYCK